MSLIGRQRDLFRRHIAVPCPCGRTLRAKPEMAGEEIRCWNCRAMVPVPIPREPGWVARALHRGMTEVLQARTLVAIVIVSIVLTATLALPGFGTVGVGVMLGFVSLIYGLLVRESSRTERSVWPHESKLKRVWQVILSLSVGFLIVSPWLINRGGPGDPPRFTKVGLTLSLISAVIVPLIILGSFARDNSGGGGFGLVFRMIRKHPFATFIALCLLPFAFICLEAIVIGIIRYEEIYEFLVLDLFPKPANVRYEFGLPVIGDKHFRALPISFYEAIHQQRLRQGYTFILGLTGSVSKLTDNGFNPFGIFITHRHYLWVRFFYIAIAGLGMLATLAIQARWLGMLSTLDTRRTVS